MAKKPSTTDVFPGPGNRYRAEIDRPPAHVIEGLRKFETPDISDLLNRLYAMRNSIHNLVNDRPICGPACTVKLYPGDNLMIHKALDLAQPGDVVVVDTAGGDTTAVIGDLVAAKATHRGIAGYVIDGYIRDLPMLRQVDLPIFARGVTPVGPLHRGPGEVNFPVSCGGIVVNPGDIIVGDSVGVVVVPAHFAGTVLDRLRAQRQRLADYVADVTRGHFSNAWVDAIIEQTGTEIVD